MRGDWTRIGFITFVVVIFGASLRVDASFPQDKADHPDGFWFGTQSLQCMTSKAIGPPLPRLTTRKRSTSSSSSLGESAPDRNSLRYIHSLVYYKDTVFEWGTGVRGCHWGPTASVTDCPVTWEPSPAGRGRCHVDVLVNYTRLYRNRFGPYHLLTNNCHHFANRVSALLSDPDCGRTARGSREVSDGIVSVVERSLWRIVSFVLSVVDPIVKVNKVYHKVKTDIGDKLDLQQKTNSSSPVKDHTKRCRSSRNLSTMQEKHLSNRAT